MTVTVGSSEIVGTMDVVGSAEAVGAGEYDGDNVCVGCSERLG